MRSNEPEIMDLQVAPNKQRPNRNSQRTKGNRSSDRQEGSRSIGWKGHEENMNRKEYNRIVRLLVGSHDAKHPSIKRFRLHSALESFINAR